MKQENQERVVTIRITLDNIVYAAGAEYAQKSGQTLKQWFEGAVAHYAGDHEDGRWQPSYPVDKFARELFIHLYVNHRDAIPSQWQMLAALIDRDVTLWRTVITAASLQEYERECQSASNLELNVEAVLAAWPRLVTRVF